MDLETIVKSLCRERHTFGRARSLTMTITDQDNKRQHLYVDYREPWELNREYLEVPFQIVTKVNGNGRNSHYIYVVIDIEDGSWYVWDLNKPQEMSILHGNMVGLKYRSANVRGADDDGNNEPLPF